MTATSTEAPTMTPAQIIELDKRMTNETVDKVMGTIKYNETKNDTKCTKRGLAGELGCYQILPSTWKGLTKKHYGVVKGFSLELEREVVRLEVIDLVEKQKLPPSKVFLYWNSGQTKQCRKGKTYDSCKYVAEAMKYFNSL